MKILVLVSFLFLFISCGDKQKQQDPGPCLIGSFGSNVPLTSFSADEIKNNEISNLEKRLLFRADGTGYYYVPVVKNLFPEFRVEFSYKYTNNKLEITAKKFFTNGVEQPSDGLNKDEALIEMRLRFYKLFPTRIIQASCTCTDAGLQTIFSNTHYEPAGIDPIDGIFNQNKITDVASWVKR